MSIQKSDTITIRKPSTGYVLSLSFGALAISFTGVGLEEGFAAGTHGHATGLLSDAGTAGIICMFGLLFASRLIFWSKASTELQTLTRTIITCLFTLSILVTLLLVVLCFFGVGPAGSFLGLTYFTALATICQIATLTWLIRYRFE